MTITPLPQTGLQAYALTTELLANPLGVDVPRPRLSWKLRSTVRSDTQVAFRIRVAESLDALRAANAAALMWDSGRQETQETLLHEYDGQPLAAMRRYFWQLDTESADGTLTTAETWFETGLGTGNWRAQWIARDPESAPPLHAPVGVTSPEDKLMLDPPAYLRRRFHLPSRPARARLYATAHGVYSPRLNGARVGADELTPGWTDYRARVMYQTYDVTDHLVAGPNVLGAILADGWWSGYVGFDARALGRHYGDSPEFLAQLVIDFADGSSMIVSTDAEWEERAGEIRSTDLLMGECVDRRAAIEGWDSPGASTSGFVPVLVTGDDVSTVITQPDLPVRVVQELAALSVTQLDAARFIVDLGQNLVGRVRLIVRDAEPGTRITLRHAEILAEGELYVANLRGARATDVYVAAGTGREVFEPTFTVHGFRYLEVTNYPGELLVTDVVGRVLSNDVATTGAFECSDAMINQLQSNITWGQRGNLVSIPTDCPQRDERLGWLADAQIFLPTATRNADVAAFYARWLADVRSGQAANGAFRDVAPAMFFLRDGAPAWGDAGVLIPWFLYERYGDRRLLTDSFDSMRKWIDHIATHNPEHLWRQRTGNNYGDWLQVDTDTPRDVVATAYYARSAGVVARAARVLGKTDEATAYLALSERIARAFAAAFIDAQGRVTGGTQTGYLLALGFDLMPAHLVEAAVGHLAADIEGRGGRLTTGFIGVSLLCPVLADHGRTDLAYALLQQDAYPSWGFSIRSGATTIWERWDGWTPDSGFQSEQMNSFNHYSLGSVGDWLYGGVAGLSQHDGSVAYAHLDLRPRIGGTLTWATAEQDTPRGLVSCGWSIDGSLLCVDVQVPPAVTATLLLPFAAAESITESGLSAASAEGWSVSSSTTDATRLTLASGTYHFRSALADR